MYTCILKNEFISLLGYKTIRLAKNRIIDKSNDLKIFSRAPNIKIADSTATIILELKEGFSNSVEQSPYLNDEQFTTLKLDQISCCHLIKDDDELENLCSKHQLHIKNNSFSSLWKDWLSLDTHRTCYEYSYFVANNITKTNLTNSSTTQEIIDALLNFQYSQNPIENNFLNLLVRTRSIIDSARDCINQTQLALIELPLLFIEESLDIEIDFDEIELVTTNLYPRLVSDRLKDQKFYGQLVADSEIKNFYKYLSKTYPSILNNQISPLGISTYLICCDQIFTKSFDPNHFEKNIKRLMIESNPEEAFMIAFMTAAQHFIKNII